MCHTFCDALEKPKLNYVSENDSNAFDDQKSYKKHNDIVSRDILPSPDKKYLHK